MEKHRKNNSVLFNLEAGKFQWEISSDKKIEAWGFNQQVPGPILRVKKGYEVIVKLKNNLDEPTVIHWHGIRLPALMDGTAVVQKPVAPGEEFEYRFTVPDAGTFWYHSHYNEAVQMEHGMYGALIVEDETDPVTDGERVLMIDDMKLSKANNFTQAKGYVAKAIERHDGREGSTLLVNGKENTEIHMAAGQIERWRFINAASAKYFRLHLNGKAFQLIGTDGGLLERPIAVTELLLVPGERADILVGPFNEGETFSMESLKYNRMTITGSKRRTYAKVKVGSYRASRTIIPDTMRSISPLAPQDAKPTREIVLDTRPSLKNGANFYINNQMHTTDKPVRVGELQIWEIINASLMDHPFHLHGFFFQILQENGQSPKYQSWKDTINIAPKGKVKIAWMPDNRPGKWMYHCHILEHHEAGMMANFEVVNSDMEAVLPFTSKECHSHK